ncbi:MAG TPA: hypothetical protein VK166_13325 [Chitinophagaceae bacterium]|nr:hypothetical protein [Chitinophagaceae bacterium]
MPVIYNCSREAIKAALAMSIAGHPTMNLKQIDKDRLIIRETLIVCKLGMGTRFTTIYRDRSGRYEGQADYCGGEWEC